MEAGRIRILVCCALALLLIVIGGVGYCVAQIAPPEDDSECLQSWDDLLEEYLEFRESSYLLVAPTYEVNPKAIRSWRKGEEDPQLDPYWFWHFEGGVRYFNRASKLGVEDFSRILIYEDVLQGLIIIMSCSDPDSDSADAQYREEIVYTAPLPEKKSSDKTWARHLYEEFARRRIVFSVTMRNYRRAKSEYLKEQESADTELVSRAMGSRSSGGYTGLWVSVQGPGQGGGGVEVTVHVPEYYTNAIEIFTFAAEATNRFEGMDSIWTMGTNGLIPGTNHSVSWTIPNYDALTNQFIAAGLQAVDPDEDYLSSGSEIFIHKTNPQSNDTDGDGALDNQEIAVGTNPLNNPGDTDSDGLSDDLETVLGTSSSDPDTDDDWFIDSYEHEFGTSPTSSNEVPDFQMVINNLYPYTCDTNLSVYFPGVYAENVAIAESNDLSSTPIQTLTTNCAYQLISESNGTRTLYAQFYRNTVEQSDVIEGSIVFENVLPVISSCEPTNNSVTDRRWIKITGAATDVVSQVQKVLINGEWSHGRSGATFWHDRIVLEPGTNVIEIQAVDNAGNISNQTLHIIQDTSGDTVAPSLELYLPGQTTDTNGQTIARYGDDADLYFSGVTDDETAQVLAYCINEDVTNGPWEAVVTGTQIWSQVQIMPNTNFLKVTASDAAGNTTTATCCVVRNTNIVFRITSPEAYQVMNSASAFVSGEASPMFLNATITVNSVAATIEDHGSNITFCTVTGVPLSDSRTELIGRAELNGEVYYTDPPPVGYELRNFSVKEKVKWRYEEFGGDTYYEFRSTHRIIKNWNCESKVLNRQVIYDNYVNCTHYYDDTYIYCDPRPVDEESNVYQESPDEWIEFGEARSYFVDFLYSPSVLDDQYVTTADLLYIKRWPTQEVQLVVLQFPDMMIGFVGWFSTFAPIDEPGTIIYRGQPGFWHKGNVSFIVPVNTEVEYTISSSDFVYPEFYISHSSHTYGHGYEKGRWLMFHPSISNDIISVTIDPEQTDPVVCWGESADMVIKLEPEGISGTLNVRIMDGETVIKTIVDNESYAGSDDPYILSWDGNNASSEPADPGHYTIEATWTVDGDKVLSDSMPWTVIRVLIGDQPKNGPSKEISVIATGEPAGGTYTWHNIGYPLEIVGSTDGQILTLNTGCLDFDTTAEVTVNYSIDGGTCSHTLALEICFPTGESTEWGGWVYGLGCTAKFYSYITPNDVDFSGATVTEYNPGGASDLCWFDGSALDRNDDGITGGSWLVGNNSKWGPDIVRIWSDTQIDYYRTHPSGSPSAPCMGIWPQRMQIVCSQGNAEYMANNLTSEIGTNRISVTRNGVTESKVYP